MENNTSKLIIVAIIFLLIGGMVGYLIPGDKNLVTSPSVNDSNSVSNKELALYKDMRKLWTDHVVWTRDYIIAAAAGSVDTKAASDRLLQNQVDIGNAVAVYYGKEAGDKITGLLKEHILIAVDVINDAKSGNQAKFDADNAKWQKNGQDIADLLAAANPNWPQEDLRDAMAMHLDTTTQEVVARLGKKYDDDVKAYDAVYNHILVMSDTLSAGIIKQFPDKF